MIILKNQFFCRWTPGEDVYQDRRILGKAIWNMEDFQIFENLKSFVPEISQYSGSKFQKAGWTHTHTQHTDTDMQTHTHTSTPQSHSWKPFKNKLQADGQATKKATKVTRRHVDWVSWPVSTADFPLDRDHSWDRFWGNHIWWKCMVI